jgi:hypothetical protein
LNARLRRFGACGAYGLAFAKPWARAVGANPVWYIDTLRTGHRGWDWLNIPLMNLVKQALSEGGKSYADPFNLGDGALPDRSGLPLEGRAFRPE